MIVRMSAWLLALLALMSAPGWAQLLKTPGEESGYSRYSAYEDVKQFLQALDQATREVSVQPVGKTIEAKDFAPAELYLCVITEEGISSPGALKRNKPTMLIVASQHGNEQSAKEAALQIIRDLAAGDLKPLLKKLNFLVIPQANPYGNFVNRRQNEQNLDLNRDHVKLESPETQAIHRVFRAWMPEVTLDVHEKGDDYYRVSTGCVSNVNIHASLQRFSRERLLAAVEKQVAADGFTWFEYLITETVGSTQAAGVAERRGPDQAREILMRYSTTDLNDGRNSLGIYETLSFIQECASRHDLETLKERTAWQYSGMRALIGAVTANGREVLSLVRERRADLLRRARKPAADQVVHLKMEYVRDLKQPELTIKRFERGTAGESAAQELRVVTEVVKNWLPLVESRLSVARPAGYVISAAHQEVIKTLRDHGIIVAEVAKDAAVEIEQYQVREIVPARDDYLAPEKIEVTKQRTKATVRKGDYYVAVAQPAANLIPCLLEPQSEYGLIRYRMYKLVPEQGAVFPILRVVRGGPKL